MLNRFHVIGEQIRTLINETNDFHFINKFELTSNISHVTHFAFQLFMS